MTPPIRHSFELRISIEEARQALREWISSHLIQGEYEITTIEYRSGRGKTTPVFVATVVPPEQPPLPPMEGET